MGNYRPVKKKCWKKYLEHLGWELDRISASHHQYVKKGAKRPIPMYGSKKEIPALHIKTSCKTLGVNPKDVYEWIEKNC